MDAMTIGEVAERAGVGVETIRFYEREGLVPEPPRTPSGYRQYPDEAVSRIRFIRRAKKLGFTLKEIKELLSLRASSDTECAEVKRRARRKVEEIQQKLDDLQRMKRALEELIRSCNGGRTVNECPILVSLED